MKQVELSRQAKKYLDKLDQHTRSRIVKGVMEFARTGYGDIETMKGSPGEYRLRVGDYRVRFTYANELLIIYVIKIGPRGDVYKA